MHVLMRAANGVNRASRSAVGAPDAERLVDNGDLDGRCRLCQRFRIPAKEFSEARYRIVAAWRTQIDRGAAIHDGLGVRTAPGVAALGTLRLWQQRVDLIDDLR